MRDEAKKCAVDDEQVELGMLFSCTTTMLVTKKEMCVCVSQNKHSRGQGNGGAVKGVDEIVFDTLVDQAFNPVESQGPKG